MALKFGQPEKALISILVAEAGIVTRDRELHWLKALVPILATPEGTSMVPRLPQL